MVVLGILVAVPIVLTLVATASGVGISQDSVSYLAAARSFAVSGELSSYTGEPLTLFPPGLSVLLGLAEWLGWDAASAAVALNALCGGLLVLATYALGRRALGSDWAALIAAAVVSLSSTTVTVLAMLWSEPLFAVLVMGALLLLSTAITRRVVTIRRIVVVGLAVSLATMVRYVGFVLIPVAGLGGWLALRASSSRVRWRAVLLVMLASSIGLVLVVVRNLVLGSGPLGERYPAARSLQGAIVDTVVQLGSYVAPPESTMLTAEAGMVVLAFLVTGAWLAVSRRNAHMTLIAGYVAAYWAAMLWSQATTRLDTATDRLAFPAFAPMAILAVYAVMAVATALIDQGARFCASSPSPVVRARGRGVVRASVWGVVGLVGTGALALSFLQGVRFANAAGDDGLFLASRASQASPLAQAARDLPGSPGLASNDPWLVYWVAGRSPVLHLPPDPAEWPAERVEGDLSLLLDRVADGSVTHVASFTDGPASLSPEELVAEGLGLTPLAEFDDGTLYRVAAVEG